MTTLVPIKHQKKKYSHKNLNRFVHCAENLLTPALKGTRTRSEQGKCGFYGYLPVEFPLHYRAFRNVHDAEMTSVHSVDDAFEMSGEGFINFILDVGPIPSNLQNPILVRRNPDIDYLRGNMKWENERRFRPESARRALSFITHAS